MRRYCKTLGPLAALPVVAAVIAQTCAAGTEDAIRGIVSRAQAIVSGRLIYVYRLTNYAGDQLSNSNAHPEATVSFSESSWADREKGRPTVYISHNGYYLDYAATPQRDGTIDFRVNMERPRALSSRDNEANKPPLFAGSFWHAPQLEYVEQHAAKFREAGRKDVNGVATNVYELDVPAEDYRKAYHLLIPALMPGGIIRLFVAPQLGYVLPRYEYATLQRAVVQSYDARDFAEVAPGGFFPKHIDEDTQAAAGVNRFHGEYDIRAELINEPIPEADFVIQLPVGTSVHDGRNAEHVVAFFIKDPTASSALADLSFAAGGPAPPRSFHRWRNSIITGVVLGIVLAIASFMVARRRRRPAPARR